MTAGPRPLTVLHLRDTERLCGPGKTIRETIRLNDDPSVSYRVAAFANGSANAFLTELGGLCPVWPLPASKAALPWTAAQVARRARHEGVGLLHAHDFKTDAVALAAGLLARLPVVTTVHGYIPISRKSELFGALDRTLLRRMDRVVAVSEAMRRKFLDAGLADARVRLIRNCIDLSAYPFGRRSGVLRREGAVDPDAVVIGHIGRLSPEKGQRLLLRAFPAILARHPKAVLVFAGDGPDEPMLRGMAEAGENRGRVRLLGHRDDVRDVFADLDLLVLSSETEGLPNVVLEAMALGVPVVATAVGGTPELVHDGATGLLVPPKADRELIDAVDRALTDGDASKERAARARQLVEREFDMKVLIARTHEMYRELAGERR